MPISNCGRTWLAAGILLLPSLLLTALLHTLAVDDAFITYRYAANLAAGLGFVYNPGQSALSTTAPLYGLLLSLPRGWVGNCRWPATYYLDLVSALAPSPCTCLGVTMAGQ